ncbi:helix-turn-helix domain-containing protein [Streptomyces sp. 2P-4]|uniref:helix-turn-helix domain-containing protein n=1 Tax=Streptomyces sp. 2P-4 TaxID=2931974 RepID=UPI00254174B9|nr:helix-turn-helix domain-containing protein [Streptomyces sp. 2P-4]
MNREIATVLRVSERSVERWRRQWRGRGEAGVLSKGSRGRPRLARSRSPDLSGSRTVVRWSMVGPTRGGR